MGGSEKNELNFPGHKRRNKLANSQIIDLKKAITNILLKEGLIPGTEPWAKAFEALEIRFMFAGPCDELSRKKHFA